MLDRRRFIHGSIGGSAGLLLSGCAGVRSAAGERSLALGGDGRLVMPDDSDFEAWRQAMTWQMRKPQRYPAAIARVGSAGDVPDVLRYAKRRGLQVAIKSGGHHLWGAALRDNAITLDLARLTDVRVDTVAKRVAVGPALWSRELAVNLSREGLAFPVAHCATVPMGGYLLGGGFGLNGDEWGDLACFNVEAADVVDASGRERRVDATTDPELFWALRGGGNGFPGVVTRFYLAANKLPGVVTESLYGFPLARAAEVAGVVAEVAAAGLPKTELMMLLAAAPGPSVDGRPNRVCILRPVVFADDQRQAERILEPLTSHPLLQEAMVIQAHKPTTIDALQRSSVDYGAQFGFGRYLVDTDWSEDPVAAVGVLAEQFIDAPGQHSHCIIILKNHPRLPEDAACSLMARSWLGRYAVWKDPREDSAVLDWLSRSSRALAPHSAGHYINEVDVRGGKERLAACFAPGYFERLLALREARDPGQLFSNFLGAGSR